MGSLGFRPPQFSEELAWLPACLQRIADTSSVYPIDPSHQQFKGFSCLEGDDSELVLPREEIRCDSFRLILSGDDNSPIDYFSSSKDVVHFRLNLSSDGDSQYYQSQLFSASCAQHGSKNVLRLSEIEIPAGEKNVLVQNEVGINALPLVSIPREVENVGEKTELVQIKDCAREANGLPMVSISRDVENIGGQSSNHANDCSEHSVQKVTVRNLKSTDIKDAVELSIAASEALVIHELVKSESASEALPTAAVLEAALQVKQARLKCSEDTFDCTTETCDEMDFLSDLDDLTMADAFEDVGLCFSLFGNQHACGSDVSLVKDTPISGYCFGSGNRTENAQRFSPLNKPSDDPTSSLKYSDPNFHDMVQDISHVSETAQRVEFSMVDASVQPQADLHCSDLLNLENAGESNASPFVTNGFRSRWFGGWIGKEADPEQPKPKPKNITNCFAAETSFFSESADVAPDENSLVRKHKRKISNIASDQSVHFEGLPDQVDEGIMGSQDVRSLNPSLVDPLCSFVPCSISSEDACSALGQNGNSGEDSAGIIPSSSAELPNDNMHIGSIVETRQAQPKFDGKYSTAKVRRQSTSLETYSKVLHENDSNLGAQRLCADQSTSSHLREKNIEMRFCDKRNYEMSLAQSPIPKCTIGLDAEENVAVNNPDGEGMNNMNHEHAKDRDDLHDQPSMGKSSLLILPQRMRQRLQAAKLLDCGSKENAELDVSEYAPVFLGSGNNLQGMESECNNDMKVPSRKRVHFSETEVQIQQNKELTKRQSLYKKPSSSRHNKRFKSVAHIQDGKRGSAIHLRNQKSLLFHDIKFLLTGFSRGKEKEIEGLIWKYGGTVLVDIPSPSNRGKRCSRHKFQQLPIILCPKKHGGGRVFKTLLWLVQSLDAEKISMAVIVSEGENRASRHLRQCASERKIPMMPSSWVVRSLYSGKLLPFTEKKQTTLHAVIGLDFPISDTWSQEI